MRKTTLCLALACLFLATPANAYETVTVGNFEARLLAQGEQAFVVGAQEDGSGGLTEGWRYSITGAEPWTQEHIDAVVRSLQTLDQSFVTGSPHRKMQIAFSLEKGPWLGSSLGTLIADQTKQNVVSTAELLLRDNIPINNVQGSVDDVVTMFTSIPLHYGPEAPAHGQYDFQATVTHEILHAMGVMNVNNADGSYPSGITRWDSLLGDSNGSPVPGTSPSITTVGELGTVFWTGAAANATYGGPVPIQTFANGHNYGSSLSHPGPPGELMTYNGAPVEFPRAPNKLLLDMYRDMGWAINEAYYNSFGPTYYTNDSIINNTETFKTTHTYTYGMYVNGNSNLIDQNGNLSTSQEQSSALSVYGDRNLVWLRGVQSAAANYSNSLYAVGNYSQVVVTKDSILASQGDGSIGVLVLGGSNSIFHSGKILSYNGATAIRFDNPRSAWGYVLNAALHIQNGSEITGNIVNSDPNGTATVTYGRKYSSPDIYQADPDFSFVYGDEIRGVWNHEITAGKLSLGASAIIEGDMANYGTLAGTGKIIGNVNSYGVIAPGNSVGTITITGNFSQDSSSDLQIEFGGGGYDQLVVSGTANLDGSLSLIPIGYLAPGKHQFISAGSTIGSFAAINNFSSSILQTSAPTSGLELGTFDLTRSSYASVLESKQQGLASAFETVRPTANGDMADILNIMDVMSQDDIRQATDNYSPYFHSSVTTASLENIRTRSTFLQYKIQKNEVGPKSPLWFTGFGGNTRYDKTPTSNDFKTKYSGFMLGVEKQFESGFQFGVAGGYTDSTFDENDTSSNASSSAYDGYLYGLWSPLSNDAFYLQSLLGLGFTDSKTNRDIPFLGRTATSDHDATHYSAFLGGGYIHMMEHWSLEPRAGLQYIHLDEDGFTENGAGAASLTIHSKDSDALLSSLGLEISHSLDVDNGLLVPHFRAEWFHNFSAETENTTAILQNGEMFNVDARTASEDSLELAVGLGLIISDTVRGHIGYQYSFADNQDGSHLLNAGLSYSF